MLAKFYRFIFSLCIIVGFALVVGTAGASDFNAIDFAQIMKQVSVGVIITAFGTIGLNVVGLERRYE